MLHFHGHLHCKARVLSDNKLWQWLNRVTIHVTVHRLGVLNPTLLKKYHIPTVIFTTNLIYNQDQTYTLKTVYLISSPMISPDHRSELTASHNLTLSPNPSYATALVFAYVSDQPTNTEILPNCQISRSTNPNLRFGWVIPPKITLKLPLSQVTWLTSSPDASKPWRSTHQQKLMFDE